MSIIFDVKQARLLGVGKTDSDPAWQIGAHTHPFWEFVYFVNGGGKIELPDRQLHPQQFFLAIYPPGLPHAEVSDPLDPEETIFCSVEVSAEPHFSAHLLLPDQDGDFRWLMQHIYKAYRYPDNTSLANLYTQALLRVIEQVWATGTPVKYDAIDFIVQYIHENYSQSLSLQALSAVAQISKSSLSNKFRLRMGLSPLQYVQRLRMEEAKRLLCTTDLPIARIAEQVGFFDALYFSRLMRRLTGYSPSSLRQYSR